MKLGNVMILMTMKDKHKPGYTAVTVRESSNPSHTLIRETGNIKNV